MFGNHLFGEMTEDEKLIEIADELAELAEIERHPVAA